MFKKELTIFFTALMFYTRIPCPQWVTHNPDYLNKATRYLPLIGYIVGGITAIVFYITQFWLPMPLAIVLAMVASILTTGAFHEDGWADACDGFGGGWTKEKILIIMKDSRLGTYGATGLFFMLLTKYSCLSNFSVLQFIAFSLVAHAVSRLCPIFVIATSSYVRDADDAKAKPLAKMISKNEILPALVFGLLPLLALSYFNAKYLGAIILPFLFTVYMRDYFKKWLGGYTGDCLGAVQQIAEVTFYVSLLVLQRV
jgi:adenosylcobinamide-GDP ribazoletransferase